MTHKDAGGKSADTPKDLLARNMVLYRRALGYSQMQLQEASGLSLSFIASLETKKKFPSADSLGKLAAALHVEVYQLFLPAGAADRELADYLSLGRLREELHQSVAETIDEALRGMQGKEPR